MTYPIEEIANTLKEARKGNGLSQRTLSAAAGVPQGHISKIEMGTVDLRISSLIELARALDLELMLVPRKSVPAIQSIVRAGAVAPPSDPDAVRKTQNALVRLRDSIENLPPDALSEREWDQFRRSVRELQNLRLSQDDLAAIRKVSQTLRRFSSAPANRAALEEPAKKLQQLSNFIAHQKIPPTAQRPAYSLDEDDDD